MTISQSQVAFLNRTYPVLDRITGDAVVESTYLRHLRAFQIRTRMHGQPTYPGATCSATPPLGPISPERNKDPPGLSHLDAAGGRTRVRVRLALPPRTYVGRSVGRAALEALLARAADGPVLATVVGKAGVGKSALVAEVLRARKSLLVLTGGGGAIPGLEALQSPFGVFTEPPSEHSHRSTA